MNGMLRTGLQFYTRSSLQRWLLAAALLLFAAHLVAERQFCRCSGAFVPLMLGMLASAAAGLIMVVAARDYRRISALRTIFLIPYSRLQLAGSMLLAQLMAAAVATGLVLLVAPVEPLAPLAWGTARGTFEMLFGCALVIVVVIQVIAGPSRILSVASLALVSLVTFRVDFLNRASILGMPKADALALAGIFVWLVYLAWYVSAWRAAAPTPPWFAGWGSRAAPTQVSRQTAIQALLLGQLSLPRVCWQQLALWMSYHLFTVALMAGIKLLVPRYTLPPNYSMAILVLLLSPALGVNTIAGRLAKGSRRLWLDSGESRPVLYAIATRLAWQSVMVLGIPLLGLAILEIRFLPHEGVDMLFPLVTCVALIPSALYLGLLSFRQRVDLPFMGLDAAASVAILARMMAESSQVQQLLWITPFVLLAIGSVLWTFSRQRWYGIDWLRFRAQRTTSPFAMRGS